MSGNPKKDDESWFTPVWEIDEETEPPGPLRRRTPKAPAEPNYNHPLLTPLALAQDAVARLEAKAEFASDAVAEGLRARMSYLEAAGWLSYGFVGIHPRDLALRDNGLTISYGAAAHTDRLGTAIPATTVGESGLDLVPSVASRIDIEVNHALGLARQWRRLAEIRSWRPLADVAAVRKTLESVGSRIPEDAEIADWLISAQTLHEGPTLIRAGRAAVEWMNLTGVKEQSPDGVFLAACLWREKAARLPIIPLSFWSAPELRHQRLGLHFGVDWMAEFLECVRAAAITGLQELERLREAEQKSRSLATTARSRLTDAVDALLRAPVVTANSLAKTLGVTSDGALRLLRQLVSAGIAREATGRASWRAYVLKG
jgi:hypothetical protein